MHNALLKEFELMGTWTPYPHIVRVEIHHWTNDPVASESTFKLQKKKIPLPIHTREFKPLHTL